MAFSGDAAKQFPKELHDAWAKSIPPRFTGLFFEALTPTLALDLLRESHAREMNTVFDYLISERKSLVLQALQSVDIGPDTLDESLFVHIIRTACPDTKTVFHDDTWQGILQGWISRNKSQIPTQLTLFALEAKSMTVNVPREITDVLQDPITKHCAGRMPVKLNTVVFSKRTDLTETVRGLEARLLDEKKKRTALASKNQIVIKRLKSKNQIEIERLKSLVINARCTTTYYNGQTVKVRFARDDREDFDEWITATIIRMKDDCTYDVNVPGWTEDGEQMILHGLVRGSRCLRSLTPAEFEQAGFAIN